MFSPAARRRVRRYDLEVGCAPALPVCHDGNTLGASRDVMALIVRDQDVRHVMGHRVIRPQFQRCATDLLDPVQRAHPDVRHVVDDVLEPVELPFVEQVAME